MADYIYKDGELYHYGVPGMKWGVRKARPESSGIRGLFKRKTKITDDKKQSKLKPAKKRKLSELSDDEIKARLARIKLEKDYVEAVKGQKKSKPTKDVSSKSSEIKKQKISELSEDELRAKITRLELEKKYKELSQTVNPPKSTEGRDFTMRIIKKIGENVLTDIGTQAGATLLGEMINKSAGVKSDDSSNRIVNPRKNQTNKK